MAKLQRPAGDKITVGPEERARFKARRKELDLDQKVVGRKVGCSAATISNLETGRHPQIHRSVYAGLQKLYFGGGDQAMSTDDAYKAIVEESADLAESDRRVVLSVIQSLKRSRGS